MSSPWIVTHRRKVHLRGGMCAWRITEPMSWLPSVSKPRDHACVMCLGGSLPTPATEAAVKAARPKEQP
jgi:hypothetical protein